MLTNGSPRKGFVKKQLTNRSTACLLAVLVAAVFAFSSCQTEDESRPLLDYLSKHQVQPEFTCLLHWKPGTLTVWDNRCTQHYPMNDYHGHKRVMHRLTLAGDVPK